MSEPNYNGLHLASGMDLRTYLAGQAMAALMSDPTENIDVPCCAKTAVEAADALIAELNKTTP